DGLDALALAWQAHAPHVAEADVDDLVERRLGRASDGSDEIAPPSALHPPRRMPPAASPILWVPVEQAVTTHMFGPRMPVSMAIWPEAVSGSMLAMKKGLTVRAPFVSQASLLSMMSCGPPPPEPKMTPISSRFSSVISSPESASACLA